MCISQIGSGEHLGDGFLIIVCLQVGAASRVSQCLSLCENKSTEMCQKINQTEACLCSLWWLWMCSSIFFPPSIAPRGFTLNSTITLRKHLIFGTTNNLYSNVTNKL